MKYEDLLLPLINQALKGRRLRASHRPNRRDTRQKGIECAFALHGRLGGVWGLRGKMLHELTK